MPLYALPLPNAHAGTLPGEHGMVVSASALASQAGLDILRRGGNAIDAVAATGFVLAVTYPGAGNVGGGGFLVGCMRNKQPFTLDFREKAPALASREMFLDCDGNVVRTLALYSAQASGVPGSVDGLLRAHRDYGSEKVDRADILARAIHIANEGFAISAALARALNAKHELLVQNEAAKAIFVRPDARPWREGDLLIQKDLAGTLTRIAAHGRRGFYRGRVATLIKRTMNVEGGLITKKDLKGYRSLYREPAKGRFGEYRIYSMGPPSSGGVLLIHMLNMLEPDFIPGQYEFNTSAYVHLLTEVQRRAYADRAEHFGDPDFWEVPTEGLLSKSYAAQRRRSISLCKATPSSLISQGIVPIAESAETTHYSIVDSQGNAAAVTVTLNGLFGSGIVVEGAGFFLNNEMDDFSAKPGAQNLYGLIGNEANSIAPNKRMLSSMTPTIVQKNGSPYLLLGSPGGPTIITTVLQVFLNVTIHGMDVEHAVAAPRLHSQWLPDQITYERDALSTEARHVLQAMGHHLVAIEPKTIGQANCILIDEHGFHGAPDPRGDNATAAY